MALLSIKSAVRLCVESFRIDSKIKDRNLEIGEVMTLVYHYSRDWTRKVKLVEIL